MTADEHKESKGSIANDSVMRDIISSLTFLDVGDDSDTNLRLASLSSPQAMFGTGKHGGVYNGLEDVSSKLNGGFSPSDDDSLVVSDIVPQPKRPHPSSPRKPAKKRRLSLVVTGDGVASGVGARKTVHFG
jgi:hypothetical protein